MEIKDTKIKKMNKKKLSFENIVIEINKIKIVLCGLWGNTPHPEAQQIIKQFKEEIDEIKRGN